MVHPLHPSSHGVQALLSSMWVVAQVVQTDAEVQTVQPSEQASQVAVAPEPTKACKVLHAVQVVVAAVESYVQVLQLSVQATQVRAVNI